MISSLLCIWRGNYIGKVKAASRLRGYDAAAVRAPLMPLSDGDQVEIALTLEALDQA
jgi:dihydrodipicolinate synthase/N-acetylneuraminate lyase